MDRLQRLHILMQEGPPLRFYIKSPKLGWHHWVEAVPTPDGRSLTVDSARFTTDSVSAYAVTYPSGEILDARPNAIRPPQGTRYFDGPDYTDPTPGYTRKLLDRRRVCIRQGVSRMSFERPEYHATSITNTGDTDIRVVKFGFLVRARLGWRDPGTHYYAPLQFREWYRVADPDGWVRPGETVTDPDNWTRGRTMWVYFFEDRRGDFFAATSLVDHRGKTA